MDPEATARIMQDREADVGDRIEAARNLLNWLACGGFAPFGWSRTEARRVCNQMIGDATRGFKTI